MAPKFGTSGLRGLVTDLTDNVVADYTRAFLAACPIGHGVHVGWDLRASSPRIAHAVMAAIESEGVQVIEAGPLPTPALALQSTSAANAAIMVTGSHIPADRNGLKFYLPQGEIGKSDEAEILQCLGSSSSNKSAQPRITRDGCQAYIDRYLSAFGANALRGLRIGVYQHTSVARDILVDLITALGGVGIPLGRAETFVPVDTEALDPETRKMLVDWAQTHHLDTVISADGDGDRPMLADHTGAIIPGDVLGVMTAQFLEADTICTPITSNSMVFNLDFDRVISTPIGSPYVIAAMEEVLKKDTSYQVVGYEANGGFLLGYTATGPAGALPPLMTRDCALPLLAPLCAAAQNRCRIRDLSAALPQRYTAADRIAGIPTETSQAFISKLIQNQATRTTFFEGNGRLDTTDGLRLYMENGDIVHLRPSGNSPELRCYVESTSAKRAQDMVARSLEKFMRTISDKTPQSTASA